MNEFKGTKGKWYHDNGNSLSIFHPEAIGVRLATVEKTSTIGKHDYDLSIQPTDEYIYNALLISKAPEMLEMLKKVEEEQSEHGYVTSDTHSQVIELIKEATEI